jgi:hypothetical protein
VLFEVTEQRVQAVGTVPRPSNAPSPKSKLPAVTQKGNQVDLFLWFGGATERDVAKRQHDDPLVTLVAGIRVGGRLQKYMIVLRLTPDAGREDDRRGFARLQGALRHAAFTCRPARPCPHQLAASV